jgi:hypothetical protein
MGKNSGLPDIDASIVGQANIAMRNDDRLVCDLGKPRYGRS